MTERSTPGLRTATWRTTGWRVAGWLARVGLSVVWIAASVPKLSDPVSFAESIANYQLIPRAWAETPGTIGILANIVPCVELVLAFSLLSGIGKRGAALGSIAMLLVFSGAIAQAMIRGINIDCGCFGAAVDASADSFAILKNVVFLAISMVILLEPTTHPRRNRPSSASPTKNG